MSKISGEEYAELIASVDGYEDGLQFQADLRAILKSKVVLTMFKVAMNNAAEAASTLGLDATDPDLGVRVAERNARPRALYQLFNEICEMAGDNNED